MKTKISNIGSIATWDESENACYENPLWVEDLCLLPFNTTTDCCTLSNGNGQSNGWSDELEACLGCSISGLCDDHQFDDKKDLWSCVARARG